MTSNFNTKIKVNYLLLYAIYGDVTFSNQTNIIINIYDLHLILDQTSDQATIYHKLDLNTLIGLLKYKDKIKFICDLNNYEMEFKYVIYNANHKKLSILFKKNLIKLLKNSGIKVKLLDNKKLLIFSGNDCMMDLNSKENTFFAVQF